MENQSPPVQKAIDLFNQGYTLALEWLLSPAAWVQFALLVGAYILAFLVSRIVTPRLAKVLSPDPASVSVLSKARRFVLMFLPLLLPLFAYGFTAIGEQVARSLFGSGAVIAFGKRVFLFLVLRAFARDILTDPFLHLLGKFVVIPIGALYALGILDPVIAVLAATQVSVGNIQFSLLAIVRGAIAGSLLFWRGTWPNRQSSDFIGRQEMRPAIQQLTSKIAEFAIFGIAFLLLMNIMGINLRTLAVLGGAIGVGLGFGLQKVVSNLVSGVIILLDKSIKPGDVISLGDTFGWINSLGARYVSVVTRDGKEYLIPNEDLITGQVVNWSHSNNFVRLDIYFGTAYGDNPHEVRKLAIAAA